MSAIAEVYKTEGNEAYLKEDYSNAIYFYTEGIKVNCKDLDLKAKLYSNRAYANLRFGETICTFANTDVARRGEGEGVWGLGRRSSRVVRQRYWI